MRTTCAAGPETEDVSLRLIGKLAATLRAMQGKVASDAQRLSLLDEMVKQGVYT